MHRPQIIDNDKCWGTKLVINSAEAPDNDGQRYVAKLGNKRWLSPENTQYIWPLPRNKVEEQVKWIDMYSHC